MKIGFDATPAIKQLGGVSEYTKQLIRHLAAIDHENTYRLVTFSLFRSKTTPLPLLPKNFHHRAVPLPARIVDRMWRKGGVPPLELFTGKVDVLFFPHIFTPYTRRPTVVTVHDLSWLLLPNVAPKGEVTEFRASLSRAVRTAKRVIAVSGATRDDLVKAANVPKEKIAVIYEGYDEALRRKPSAGDLRQFRRRHHLKERPYFLFVGTLEPRKNLVRLVRAFDRFKATTKLPHQLVLIGRFGWGVEEVRRAIDRSVSKEAIKTLGSLPDPDRRLAYWGSDAVVFPSLYEGFGIPVLEGQAAERPVLSGTGGSLKEVGGDSVLYVAVDDEAPIADGMRRLVADQSLRDRLKKKGLENIKRFSWDKMARETLRLLEEVGT